MKLLAFAALAVLVAAPTKGVDPAPIVAAERAFAADGAALGIAPSFLRHSASDAVMIDGTGVTSPKAAFAGPPPTGPQPLLAWWPLWAGIAQSGDLGFTSGPVELGGKRQGYYFTVWKKQANGTWKWIYDGGAGASSAGEPPAATQPLYLHVSTVKPMPQASALAEVAGVEARFAAQARADQKAAFAAVLAPDAHAYVPQKPAAVGRAAVADVLGAYPSSMEFGKLAGGEASKAGDLAYAYGQVRWATSNGWYVHVWQRRADGWKLVFAQIVTAR